MHEWAVAEGVVDTLLELGKKERAKRIVRVKLRVGELRQIERDLFEFALRELAKGTIAEGMGVEVEVERSVMCCRVCGFKWSFDEVKEKLGEEENEAIHFLPDILPVYVKCPGCGSVDFEVSEGRGVVIWSVEMEK